MDDDRWALSNVHICIGTNEITYYWTFCHRSQMHWTILTWPRIGAYCRILPFWLGQQSTMHNALLSTLQNIISKHSDWKKLFIEYSTIVSHFLCKYVFEYWFNNAAGDDAIHCNGNIDLTVNQLSVYHHYWFEQT